MHTNVIPTSLYLSFVMMCWAAKAFLMPVRWFPGKGKELNSPLNLSAAFCALIEATFGVGVYAVSTWQEYVERRHTSQAPAAIVMSYSGSRQQKIETKKILLETERDASSLDTSVGFLNAQNNYQKRLAN